MSIQPEILREKYTKFLREDRVLLTGHSHQAWPDCAAEALAEAFHDAADLVDDKWGRAFAKASAVRIAIQNYCGAETERIVLGQNTHELFFRLLSSLPSNRAHIVATSGEFHSVRRQLIALEARGLRVSWVPAAPAETLSERLNDAITPKTSAIVVSSVLFETSEVVPHLDMLVERAVAKDVEVFIDGYHAFMAVPCTFNEYTSQHAFISGGGYKYAQWGEGVCWMTVPSHYTRVPTFTGWFSDFKRLDELAHGQIGYGESKSDAFAGSTYDPISHYRAARVIEFFESEGLTIQRLRALSIRQTTAIIDHLGDDGLVSPLDANSRGGFVTYRVEDAPGLVSTLRTQGIFSDARGDYIRFGPAPYVTLDRIEKATSIIKEFMKPIR